MGLVEKYTERLVEEEQKELVILEFLTEFYKISYTKDFYSSLKDLVILHGAEEVFLVALLIANRYKRFQGSPHKALIGLLSKILHSNTEKHLNKSLLTDLSGDINAFRVQIETVAKENSAEEIIRIIFDE